MADKTDKTRKAIAAASNATWRANNKEARAAYMKKWEAENRDARNAYKREQLLKNPELRAENQARAEAWVQANREARKEHQRRYREKNRGKIREAGSKSIRDENGEMTAKYKARLPVKRAQRVIDLETVAGRPRPKVCDVCQKPPDPTKGLHFDHCHQRGHFRGWLCRSCNLALGNVQDDPNILRKLADYLESNADGTPVLDILRQD
jgi:hypothetical protein